MKHSLLRPRQKPPKRSRIKKHPRKPSETLRIYGGKKRIEFVKSLPCAACGLVGYSENAHYDSGGIGRKSDYTHILPLCGYRFWSNHDQKGYNIGCHRMLHAFGRESLESRWRINLEALAAETQAAWLSFSGGSPKTAVQQSSKE